MLDIAEVSKRSGMPASTLRHYEEKGLIESLGRRGLRRLFGTDVLDRLSLIALGKLAGFTLDEIARMFGQDDRLEIDRTLLCAKADELDRTIWRLNALRKGLRHAAACPATSHMQCSKFRALMKVASARQVNRRSSLGSSLLTTGQNGVTARK